MHPKSRLSLPGMPLRYQMCTTGAANSICPMRSRRTRLSVISTPHLSQIIPLNLGPLRLYFPQAHSKLLVGPKMRSQNRPSFSGLRER
ncbi:MAG: hypothetical protein BWY99_01203 [Synergistetes bacterium ADurb.BinA166]|nr:MAG: hypothetical protein BWY99_01203 [Synergistetes bacterium ADurb.BinA166]